MTVKLNDFDDYTIEVQLRHGGLYELILRNQNDIYHGSMITKSSHIINDHMFNSLLEHAKIIRDNS